MNAKFETLTDHRDGEREPLRGGTVILSRLGRGESRLRAAAPSVKFVLRGEAIYEIEGRKRRVRAGEFLLVDDGTRFTASVQGSDGRIAMCVYLGSTRRSPLSGEGLERLAAPILQGFTIDPFARLLREHAIRLARHPQHGQLAAAQVVDDVTAGAEDFLMRFSAMERSLGALKQSTRIETLNRLERARAFIHERTNTPLTLDEIADAAHLSRFHLSRTFAQTYGAAPLSYHRGLRLEAAARRLAKSECSATHLAQELGYASLSAFSRAFARQFGAPPSQAEAIASPPCS
jgi:AraC-like DNA-binding protein